MSGRELASGKWLFCQPLQSGFTIEKVPECEALGLHTGFKALDKPGTLLFARVQDDDLRLKSGLSVEHATAIAIKSIIACLGLT